MTSATATVIEGGGATPASSAGLGGASCGGAGIVGGGPPDVAPLGATGRDAPASNAPILGAIHGTLAATWLGAAHRPRSGGRKGRPTSSYLRRVEPAADDGLPDRRWRTPPPDFGGYAFQPRRVAGALHPANRHSSRINSGGSSRDAALVERRPPPGQLELVRSPRLDRLPRHEGLVPAPTAWGCSLCAEGESRAGPPCAEEEEASLAWH